jgi:multiple sugar transport system ATP-binding protein
MAEVKLEGVSKRFGTVEAVKDFNLEIRNREFLVLVGPSGCGKSTLLRMIAGLEEISEGRIYIGDKVVNNLHPKDRDIAMVFQDYGLYPHMSVYNNMAFGLKLKKTAKAEIEQRVGEAAAILGIEDLLERRPLQLSGGQRQRVALGRAIVRNPAIFLFDEPLSNLDAKLRVQMRAELTLLHERLQTTVIYVTHDQVEAMTMGTKIAVMNDGRLQQVGSPLEVYRFPRNRFVSGFIGNPPTNFINAKVVMRDGVMCLEAGKMLLEIPEEKRAQYESYINEKVIFGIRPEHVCEKLPGMACKPEFTARAKVEVIEPLGSETLLHLSVGTLKLMGKTIPLPQLERQQEIQVFLDMEEMHIFEREGEQLRVSAETEDLSHLRIYERVCRI